MGRPRSSALRARAQLRQSARGFVGIWAIAANWSTDPNLPGPDDRVIIPADKNVFIRDNESFTADSLEIGALSKLQLDGTGMLTLENDNIHCGGSPSPACGLRDNHLINGFILLNDESQLRFVDEEQHVLGGGGYIQGQLPGVVTITIDDGVLLRNQLGNGMKGGMTITGDGEFRNESFVQSGGLIVLDEGLTVSDVEGAEWLVLGICQANYGGVMEFHEEAVLFGDFESNFFAACFFFYADVETFGAFIDAYCSGVWVDEENSISFCYWEYVDNGCDPGDPPGVGEDPYCIVEVYCAECSS
jgi:hypothetical protein